MNAFFVASSVGIIPACAGSTPASSALRKLCVGSSPHARGARPRCPAPS